MPIIVSTTLFISITALVWLLNKILPFKICPICIGVSGSWFVLTVLLLAGAVESEKFIPFVYLLMGGSVVGIAYKSEHSFFWARANPMSWKLIVISVGMPFAYLAVSFLSFKVLIAEIIALLIMMYLFFLRDIGDGGRESESASLQVKELEKKMKECC